MLFDMLKQILKKQYGIDANESMPLGPYQSCRTGNQRLFLVPVTHIEEEEFSEIQQIVDHLKNSGDQNVCTILDTKEKGKIIELESENYCVLSFLETRSQSSTRLGRKLAKFHFRGRKIPFSVKNISRIGQWKKLWETRIDQMEGVWNNMIFQEPENEFDRMFLESFPYYMAITENAIQYLVDTELDDDPKSIDNGTVCHSRFTNTTWGEEIRVKNPFDWVFDHCSRDLAEWTRERYLYNYRTYQPEVKRFFQEYQTVEPLSSFAWRLLYARLMFPLHYVECVEDYYSTSSEKEKRLLTERMERYLHHSRDHEKFLQDIYAMLEVPVQRLQIPSLEWL